jgi:hypothetical protein
LVSGFLPDDPNCSWSIAPLMWSALASALPSHVDGLGAPPSSSSPSSPAGAGTWVPSARLPLANAKAPGPEGTPLSKPLKNCEPSLDCTELATSWPLFHSPVKREPVEAERYLPLPCFAPVNHAPTYVSPLAYVYTQWPCRLLYRQQPSYKEPSLYIMRPSPCFWLASQSPQ